MAERESWRGNRDSAEEQHALLANLNVSVGIATLRKVLARLDSIIDSVGLAFVNNLVTVEHLLILPEELVERTVRADTLWNMLAARAFQGGGDITDPLVIADAQRTLESEMMSSMIRRTRNRRLNELMVVPNFEAAVRAIFTSATALTWTAVEVLAGDLWEAVLNAHPNVVPDSMLDKTVSISQLHRHGFDLRKQMGTVLRPKVSFKSVDGIRKAYAPIFKNSVTDTLDCPPLVVLEATRHVLVHRAGIIDADYIADWKSFTGKDLFAFEPGDIVPLDACIVSAFVNAAAFVGRGLLHTVNEWLETQRVS